MRTKQSQNKLVQASASGKARGQSGNEGPTHISNLVPACLEVAFL